MARLQVTESFRQQLKEAWGNPRAVADAGMNELFRHGDEVGLDQDDQVEHALTIGVLAGTLHHEDNSQAFTQAFEEQILNQE